MHGIIVVATCGIYSLSFLTMQRKTYCRFGCEVYNTIHGSTSKLLIQVCRTIIRSFSPRSCLSKSTAQQLQGAREYHVLYGLSTAFFTSFNVVPSVSRLVCVWEAFPTFIPFQKFVLLVYLQGTSDDIEHT